MFGLDKPENLKRIRNMNIKSYRRLKGRSFLNTPDTKYRYESEDFIEAMGRTVFNLREIKDGDESIINKAYKELVQ